MTGGSAPARTRPRRRTTTSSCSPTARAAAGRTQEPFAIYLALAALPDVDLYRRFEDAGVTDMVCAPWMLAEMKEGRDYRSALDAKLAASEEFATTIIAKMG